MSRKIETEIEIEAPPAAVWKVLTDFDSWPQWNPFIVSLEGAPEAGRRILIEIQPPGGRRIRFRPVVLVCEPDRALIWKGKVIVSGLFDGEHRFELEAVGEGRTRFVQVETFTGILVPLLWNWMAEDTRSGFQAMNHALKHRVEHGP